MATYASPSTSYFLDQQDCYVTVQRDCDNPYWNFERIKNQELWLKREKRIHEAKLKEFNERDHA